MRKILLLLVVALVFGTAKGNYLISYEKIDSFDQQKLADLWHEIGIPKFIAPIRYSVDVYNVIYRSVYPDKSETEASGVYFVPREVNEDLPRLIYNHGTSTKPERHLGYNGESTICLMFATDGYAVLAPDYFGLGYNNRVHPYHHADSEGQAAVDMLKAIEELDVILGKKANDFLFISGYSQGGHATLAVHRKLQMECKDRYPVTASSPMSGAYDLANTQAEVMYDYYTQPHYLPYLLIGYNEVYKVYPEDSFFQTVFVPPYDTLIPRLFDRSHPLADVNAALPDVPMNMLNPSLVERFRSDSTFYFRQVLEENSVYDWKPESPVQLCYCTGDEEVKYENALVAYRKMKENGAEHVRLKRVGGKKFTHRKCADFAVLYTKFYFDSFLKGSKTGRKGPVFKRMIISMAKIFR